MESYIGSMENLRKNLEDIWDCSTSWKKTGKQGLSVGQCYVTALLVQELFKGVVLKEGDHYWNRLSNGEEFDLTSDQYGGDGIHPIRTNGKSIRGNRNNRRFMLLKSRFLRLG